MEKINTGGRGQGSFSDRSKWGPRNKRVVDNTWQPFLGAAVATCGTVFAIISVPDNPQPSGALFWPAVWCTLGFLTVPILGLRTTTQSIFRAENLIMLGLI